MSTATLERIVTRGAFRAEAIDREQGLIRDVGILTGETEALGHETYVDQASVQGLAKLLLGRSLPAYITHGSFFDFDRITQEVGIWSGFYLDGLKVRARQFQFLRSFEEAEPAKRNKLLELAEKMPEQFGVSIVFGGYRVWVTPDGDVPYDGQPRPDNALREMPSIRFTEIESADFVKQPAANPSGLFGRRVDGDGDGMANTPDKFEAQFNALKKDFDAQAETFSKEREALTKQLNEANEALSTITVERDELSASLATEKTERAEEVKILKAQLATAEKFSAAHLGVRSAEFITGELDAVTPENFWQRYNAISEPAERTAFYRAHKNLISK